MFVLLTTLLILASGKTLCQESVIIQRFTSEATPVLSSREYSTRDFNRPLQLQPTIRPFLYTRQSTEKFKDLVYSRNNPNRTIATQPAIVNQQKRRVLISRVITQRVNQNQLVNTPTVTRVSTSPQVNMDVYDKVKFEEDPPIEINSVNSNGTALRNVNPQPSTVSENTSKKPVTKPVTPAAGNLTEVTLDERSSFDGDQCPTGYVRVNGMCVQPD